MPTMPTLFVAHGAPPLLDDATWVAQLAAWARALPRPASILVISAHHEGPPLRLGATRTVPLTYDFYGFPERHYTRTYPAPGAPALAERVRALAAAGGWSVVQDPERGLDHGAYVPLVAMYPEADVPVLQLSLPSLDPRELLAMGRMLAPLRREGVLILGSGFLVHNPGALSWAGGPPPPWALAFDTWIADALTRGDLDALADFEVRAPEARRAHPRAEHLAPLFVAVGAARGEAVRFPIEGWAWGAFSKRSVQLGDDYLEMGL